MSEAVAEGFTLTRLKRVSARLEPYDWVWARENADAIERNWARRRDERPGMFDGTVLLSHRCVVRDDACEISFFETPYSRFIASRDARERNAAVANAFSAIVPYGADGAILLGEMAPHTANAGQIYFPCGTPDRDDLRAGGIVDLAGSAEREFREETGLDLPAETGEAPWVLMRGEGQLAFLRPVRFEADADTLAARSRAHLLAEAEPELSRIVVARGPADLDPVRMPGFVRAYLANAFDA